MLYLRQTKHSHTDKCSLSFTVLNPAFIDDPAAVGNDQMDQIQDFYSGNYPGDAGLAEVLPGNQDDLEIDASNEEPSEQNQSDDGHEMDTPVGVLSEKNPDGNDGPATVAPGPDQYCQKTMAESSKEPLMTARFSHMAEQAKYWDLKSLSLSVFSDELPALLTPMTIGSCQLTHRFVLAPLTRRRATEEREPRIELSPSYYSQRATRGGFLVSEATSISQQGTGSSRTPGIYTKSQIEAWKPVTEAVEDRGAFFFLQLWHVGRASHSQYQSDSKPPVAPSPIALQGTVCLPDDSTAEYEAPRELTADKDIPAIIEDYRQATKNAVKAGFNGVEIHAANGYLIDQFLHDGSNTRSDKYGGSIENRARFLFEVLDAVIQAWREAVGSSSPRAANVGIRFSPFGTYQAMSDSNEAELFRYIIAKINNYQVAYIHVNDQRAAGMSTIAKTEPGGVDPMRELLRLFAGPLILAGGYHPASASEAITRAAQENPPQQVAVAFGKAFIANPDLPLRVLLRAPIVHYDRKTFYTHESVGYIDQPSLTEEEIASYIEDLRGQLRENPMLLSEIQNYVQLLKH